MTIDGNLSVELLTWAMDKALASHNISRVNVANANVEGYKALSISFDQQLTALREASSAQEIEATLASISQNLDEMLANNTIRTEEAVRLDAEVADMVKHSGKYQTLADVMSRKLGLMKLAITSRG